MNKNQHYWNNKEQRAQKAQEWNEKMKRGHSDLIQNSIEKTRIYSGELYGGNETQNDTEIILTDLDSVSAVCKYGRSGKKTAVLNFASYKNPGGMFLKGSKAQEECLCHESFLYNILYAFEFKYYEKNRKDLNRALYRNKALYSPDIHFYHNSLDVPCDVITCAAPNYSAAHRYQRVTVEENYQILESRIKFVLDIAEANHVETLILGAFGCGVFGQNPADVAEITNRLLKNYSFNQVVFAILDKDSENYKSFERILRE